MRVTLVAGMPRQGKTTLALRVARKEAKRLLVLDPARSAVMEGLRTVGSWPELGKWLVTPEASSPTWEMALRSKEPADYAAVLRCAEHMRHVTLLIDEVLTFASDASAEPWLVKMARTSAHYGGGPGPGEVPTGLSFLMTAQRPMDIPPDVRATITRLFVFRTREPGDLDWLKRFTQDPETAERVAGLEPHQYLEIPPPTTEREATDESVLDGGTRSGDAAGAVSGGAQAEPATETPGPAEVRGTKP